MGRHVALCVDDLAYRSPNLVGLDGESLESQAWLSVFVKGAEARRSIGADDDVVEAWVASCDDVDSINLAATLKQDRPELPVFLVVSQSSGSLSSRAHTASIDGVLEGSAFMRRYAEAKARYADVEPANHSAAGQTFAVEPVAIEVREPEAERGTLPSARPTVLQRPTALASPRKSGFILPVVSGSGGAGKSAVSVIAAFVSAEMGYRTLLVDYDLQFGDMAILTGMAGALTIDEAMAHPGRLEREMGGQAPFVLLAAPDRLEKSENVVREMPAFLDDMIASFDVIVANTGAAWAEQHAVLLERSYVSLFLIDQRASSIRACKHALELCARCGIASGPFEYALNRCAKGAPLTAADVSCALQTDSVFELRDGGRDVEDYLGSGSAAELLQTGNDFCESVRQVMARLLPQGLPLGSQAEAETQASRTIRRRGRHVGRKRGRKQ